MNLSRRAMIASGAAALAAGTGMARAQTDARALHKRLICIDTHLDMPANLARPGWDVMQRHSYDEDFTQVDYPRMIEGGLDGGFFSIYTPQAPVTPEGMSAMRDAGLLRAAEIREMVAAHPDKFELAFVPEDAARIAAKGKIIVFQSIENSGILGNDVTLLRGFYKLGVRMAGPIHFLNNQLGDSATDKKQWGGLSPLGKEFVKEANDLGIVLDASHSSDDVFDQMMDLSRTAIICSHSGCRAIHDHPRNLDDARIKRLAASGSTIQINSYNEYLVTVPPNPDRDKARRDARSKMRNLGNMPGEQATAIVRQVAAELRAIDKQYPSPRADFEEYMKHVTHALDLVGPDHVGVGADWDGGGGVTGMNDVTSIPKITERLVKAGYTEAQLGNFWSGNALRVLGKAHSARKQAG
ncbi:MAG TPA: dipeptidase [Rhizomicrobium sp.]